MIGLKITNAKEPFDMELEIMPNSDGMTVDIYISNYDKSTCESISIFKDDIEDLMGYLHRMLSVKMPS